MMRRTVSALTTTAVVAAMVAACGGGSRDEAGQAFVRAIATEGAAAPTPVPASAPAPGAKELFDWAEYRYPALFYPKQTFVNYDLSYAGQLYSVRSFANGNHLGLTPDGRIYGLGPFTGNVLQGFGVAADYAALVAADKCSVNPPSCFALGASHTVNVTVAAGGEVNDAKSGVRLLFPDGAAGQVTMTQLSATPPAPAPGAGWRIEYSGSQKMEIVLSGAFDGSADWPAVYRFEELTPGAVDDDRGLGPRWVPLPMRQVAAGRYAFEVSPGSAGAAGGTSATVGDPRRHALATARFSSRDHHIAQVAKASTDTERRVAQYSLGNVYIDEVIATLPGALATQVRQRRAEKLLSWGNDGNYYRGFTFLISRRLYPQINVTFDNNSLAHELGHYLTHMLVGHDVYEQLEAQPYPTQHGILDVVGRGSINEDYAYLIEYFLIRSGGNSDLFNPNSYLRGRPAGADVPAIEGFAAAMMASLVRPTTAIPGFDNKDHTVDVPTIGLTYGQVFNVIAAGATDVNALRRRIEAVLDDDGRRRFLVNLQRIGWRYSATLRVVDASGKPVTDADARLLVRAGGSEYVADVGRTDAQGGLNLWFAFPGQSTLVVSRAGETLEGPIALDPDRSTQERIAVGDVTVAALETFTRLREVCASFSYTTITALSRIVAGPFTRFECVQPPSSKSLTWGGSMFSVRDGETYVEGYYAQQQALVTGLKARRPHSGSYKTQPPLFEIIATDLPRDLKSAVIRFRLEGSAAAGRYTIKYQPEDDCGGGFCEARAVKEIIPGSVSVSVSFSND